MKIVKNFSSLPYIGQYREKIYKKFFDNDTVNLLFHLPINIEVREKIEDITSSHPDNLSTLTLEICQSQPSFRKGAPFRIFCTDSKEMIELIFFNYKSPFLKEIAIPGKKIVVSGQISCKFQAGIKKWQMLHPNHIGSISTLNKWIGTYPIYPLTAGITQSILRSSVNYILQHLSDTLEWIDSALLKEKQWPSWKDALIKTHYPKTLDDLDPFCPARQRLAYDELLAHQLSLHFINYQAQLSAPALKENYYLQQQLFNLLPFSLTENQKSVFCEISKDLSQPVQMLRLLQGDVGSGKTVISICAALQAIESGYQAAILAPTDILARQHFHTIEKLLVPLGLKVSLLTAKEKATSRQQILTDLEQGHINFLVGTHAIFQEKVIFKKLGLVIIDEQHRFGVKQRLALSDKGSNPHILSMTATPIPRTLVLANYGEMNISLLKEKPAGRQPIVTRIISINKIDSVIQGIERALKQNQQIYWVCPLVEESEKIDLAAATQRYEYLNSLFPNKIALIHGRMKSIEKELSMQRFVQGSANILVATTVIEVGVDVPNAQIIIIEHAERFGLAQLHQLRGRVGRGTQESICILLYGSPLSIVSRKRLETMRATNDGFIIAEADLKLRGSGEILGTRQSGLPQFRLLDFNSKEESTNELYNELLDLANKDAKQIFASDPEFCSERGKALRILLSLFKHEAAAQYKRSG